MRTNKRSEREITLFHAKVANKISGFVDEKILLVMDKLFTIIHQKNLNKLEMVTYYHN